MAAGVRDKIAGVLPIQITFRREGLERTMELAGTGEVARIGEKCFVTDLIRIWGAAAALNEGSPKDKSVRTRSNRVFDYNIF